MILHWVFKLWTLEWCCRLRFFLFCVFHLPGLGSPESPVFRWGSPWSVCNEDWGQKAEQKNAEKETSVKLEPKESMTAKEISSIQKKLSTRDKKMPWRLPRNQQDLKHCRFKVLGVRPLDNCFPRVHFCVLCHSGAQSSLQSWSKRAWLLLYRQQTLALSSWQWFYWHKECKDYIGSGSFLLNFKGRSVVPGKWFLRGQWVKLWNEARSTVETSENWRI